jgi:hypothetical protein
VFRRFCCTQSFRWPASGSAFASFLKPREYLSSGSKAICAQDVHCENWEELGSSWLLPREYAFRAAFASFMTNDVMRPS